MLVDSTADRSNFSVTNTLNIPAVSRADRNASFTCRARNNNQTRPSSRAFSLNIRFAPRSVRLVGLPTSLQAGRAQTAICRSDGSEPPPALTWWMDGQFLKRPAEVTVAGVTTSRLEIIFSSEDDRRTLSCRAENKFLPDSTVSTERRLDVSFAPRVRLQFGSKIEGSRVSAGQDVYMECLCRANPAVSRISWLRDGFAVEPRTRAGPVVSGHSLVIQAVKPQHSGNYSCVASNPHGDAVSSPLRLAVQFRPVCSSPGPRRLLLPLNLAAEVVCRVRAHPPPSQWWWTFNNSRQLDRVPSQRFSHNETASRLRYSPLSPQDYGELHCWAANSEGEMEEPCSFQVVQASRASHALQCNLHNQTGNSLLVLCAGDTQDMGVFHLEVRDRATGELVQNLTSDTPRFLVTDLPPANWLSGLNLTVYTASQEPGTINTVETLGVSTSKVAELQHESAGGGETENVANSGPLSLAVLCGIVLTVTCLLSSLSYPAIRLCVRNSGLQSGPQSPLSAPVPSPPSAKREAYTVFDSVDLLLPAQGFEADVGTVVGVGGAGAAGGAGRRTQIMRSRERTTQDSLNCLIPAAHTDHESVL